MAEASIEAGKGKVPDGPMMADVGDGTTAITLPERVDNSNVLAVLKSLEAECKARRLTKESRVLVDLVRLKEFDSTVLSALLEMGRYAGKPLAVHNPPRKLVSLSCTAWRISCWTTILSCVACARKGKRRRSDRS